MQSPPKQTKCGCGRPSTMCVHGADGALWMCKACVDKLMGLLGNPDARPKELTDLLARGDLVTALLQRHFPNESPTPVLIAAAAYAKRDRLTRAEFIAGAGAAYDGIRVELLSR